MAALSFESFVPNSCRVQKVLPQQLPARPHELGTQAQPPGTNKILVLSAGLSGHGGTYVIQDTYLTSIPGLTMRLVATLPIEFGFHLTAVRASHTF